MPRKNAMRDNVNAVRSQLPHLSDLSREKIELALLYYESNVDETVQAFKRNGAIEALRGWTEKNNSRGNASIKRTSNKPLTLNTTPVAPSSGILRPSQRVSNIFQTFAEGGTPQVTTNGSITMSNTTTTTCSPSSLSSSSFIEQFDHNLQSNLSLNHDPVVITPDETTNISTTIVDDVFSEEIPEQQKPTKSQRRKSVKNRNSSTSSITHSQEPGATPSNQQATTTGRKPSNSTTNNNNKKLLTKSAKDLQRQTSTLSNVELSFNNEIKSSIKRIDDLFKQIREIIKEREVELYLEMDKVKEQGLNVIHRRQQRGLELRQRVNHCDRLEPLEIDHLRGDIKQFVTDRRYDLGEELTSLHRFEYDPTVIEALKKFGTILKIDRKHSMSNASSLLEANTTTTAIESLFSGVTPEKERISVTNGRTPSISSPSNEVGLTNNQPLPQRINNNKQSNEGVINTPINGNTTGDYHQNSASSPTTNGHLQYYEDTNYHQNVNRRRPQQYSQNNFQRPRPLLDFSNMTNRRNVPRQPNGRGSTYNNSETTNNYHRPRPPSHSIVPVYT